ncbi:MAG: nucleotidyltransferase domain-containing protein [Pseudomonadota bacterium]
MTHPTLPTPAEALAIARAVIESRYPGAAFAFAAGSILRGEGTLHSDIDLVVVFDRLEVARRESFLFEGVPVEAFVHDEETLAWAVNSSAARGRPGFPALIAEATLLGRAPERGERVRHAVAAMLAKGPPPMAPAQVDAMRYAITEFTNDLRGERTPAEALAIGIMLYPPLVELALRGRGKWNATGKWVPRSLAEADDALAGDFDRAFRALFATGACEAVIALVERELAPHGGPRFDGDQQRIPAPRRA